jgi:hypothetical protein
MIERNSQASSNSSFIAFDSVAPLSRSDRSSIELFSRGQGGLHGRHCRWIIIEVLGSEFTKLLSKSQCCPLGLYLPVHAWSDFRDYLSFLLRHSNTRADVKIPLIDARIRRVNDDVGVSSILSNDSDPNLSSAVTKAIETTTGTMITTGLKQLPEEDLLNH